MTTQTTKAWTVASASGDLISQLRLGTHELKDVGNDHVLIETLNLSLNPGDLKFPKLPLMSWRLTPPISLGFDFCGRILALPPSYDSSKDSRNLHVGQVVYGLNLTSKPHGVTKTVLRIPIAFVYPLAHTIPVEHGAAFGIGALTAYQSIAPYVKPGSKVLINGGSGGTGTFGIQIAKALGTYVIATASSAGAQLCRDLGADEVLDYKSPTFQEDIRRTQVDLVVDNVGNDNKLHRHSVSFLKPDGVFTLVGIMDEDFAGIRSMLASYLLPTWLGGTPRKWKLIFMKNGLEDYEAVMALTKKVPIRVVVDSTFPFSKLPQAYERLQSGRVKGKILIDVANHGN